MPSAAEHQAKYERNRAYLDTGLAGANPEWAAVVAFYAAVHLVEKLAAAGQPRPRHHATHYDRETWLSTHRQHRAIFNDYEVLRDASAISRYGTVNQFQRLFTASVVQTQLIDVHLAAIEQHVAAVFLPPALRPHHPCRPRRPTRERRRRRGVSGPRGRPSLGFLPGRC